MTPPERMRLQSLIDWLVETEGLSETEVRKLVKNKVIIGRPLMKGDKRNYYLRSQVQRDVLDAHHAAVSPKS